MSNGSRRGGNERMSTKWVGGASLRTILTTVSQSVASPIALVPASALGESPNDTTVVGGRIHVAIRRTDVALVEAFGYIVALQDTDQAGTVNQVLEPLSTDPFTAANKDILSMGLLPVPANMPNSTGAPFTSREVAVTTIHLKTSRKLQRARHTLTFTQAADVSTILKTFVSWRILLKY